MQQPGKVRATSHRPAALALTRLGTRSCGGRTHANRFPVNHNLHPAVFRPPGAARWATRRFEATGLRSITRDTRHFALLHQRHALGELVPHYGANLVFDLQVTRDFDGRQRFAELGRESAFDVNLCLLDRVGLID